MAAGGKISAKGAVIVISTLTASSYVTSYEIEWAKDVIDVTGFNDGWQNYIVGMPIVSFTLNMLWDGTASTGVVAILKAMMSTAATCSIVPEASGITFSGTFLCGGFTPQGTAASGALTVGSVKFYASGTTLATFA
jgi:hypothetical protein